MGQSSDPEFDLPQSGAAYIGPRGVSSNVLSAYGSKANLSIPEAKSDSVTMDGGIAARISGAGPG